MKGSLNKYAGQIIKEGIFNNITNFDELNLRLSNIKSLNSRTQKQTQGDAFEIFCEALLNTSKNFVEAIEVWPQGEVPHKVLKKLNLPDSDRGYDGVYRTIFGYNTYQSKYRTDINSKLKWAGPGGLSTFAGVSHKASKMHLMSNTVLANKDFNKLENILSTLYNDFNILDIHSFKRIEAFLKSKKVKDSGPHKLDKYQSDMVTMIRKDLVKKNRTTSIMACGTGKTEIGVEVYKIMKPKLALILSPSIALVSQLRTEWFRQIGDHLKFSTISVVSNTDRIGLYDQISSNDIHIDKTTDVNQIKQWLKTKTTNKIIFSTYQSSKLIGQALTKKGYIDFAVFDEAHRTAIQNPNIKSSFSYALHDQNIKIKKRLFMTATRRLSNYAKRNMVGDSDTIISMDNKLLYGDVGAKNISFSKASNQHKCIAKLKVITSEIFSDDIELKKLVKSSTHIGGQKYKSEHIAMQLSIARAIKKYKLNKVFTFHNTVNRAKNFVKEEEGGGIKKYLDNDFYLDYVKGQDSMAKRKGILKNFKTSQKSLISNARCLVEGVNVPSVNMVVFADPKNSGIDVVQAAGRALRNRHDKAKKFGYVLVPLFIEKHKNETISKAIERSDYSRLIDFLQAISEHDDEIAEIIKNITLEGRGKGNTHSKKSIISFIETANNEIKEALLKKKIESNIIEKIQTVFDSMFIMLSDFYKKYGHYNVPRNDKYKDLHVWITNIRRFIANDLLPHHRIMQLEGINFPLSHEGVTLQDTSKLVTLTGIRKLCGVDLGTIKDLKDQGKLKPLGQGVSSKGISDYFKKPSIIQIKKMLNIDFFSYELKKHNLAAMSQISDKFKIPTVQLKKLVNQKKLKTSGFCLSAAGRIQCYKIPTKTKIFRLLDIDTNNLKGLFSAEYIGSKYKINPKYILNLSSARKIKSYKTTQGLRFKMLSKKQLLDMFKVTHLNAPKNYQTINGLKVKFKFGDSRILKKSLKPIGFFLGKGRSGRVSFYKNYSKKELFSLLNIVCYGKSKSFLRKEELANLYDDLNIRRINTLIKEKKILSVGESYGLGGKHPVYKKPSAADVKKFLGISILSPHKFYTLRQIANKYSFLKSSSMLFRLHKEKKIKSMGIAYIKTRACSVFKMVDISTLKKLLNITLIDTKGLVSRSAILKKHKIDPWIINKLIKHDILTSEGTGLSGNSGTASTLFFKMPTTADMKKMVKDYKVNYRYNV